MSRLSFEGIATGVGELVGWWVWCDFNLWRWNPARCALLPRWWVGVPPLLRLGHPLRLAALAASPSLREGDEAVLVLNDVDFYGAGGFVEGGVEGGGDLF